MWTSSPPWPDMTSSRPSWRPASPPPRRSASSSRTSTAPSTGVVCMPWPPPTSATSTPSARSSPTESATRPDRPPRTRRDHGEHCRHASSRTDRARARLGLTMTVRVPAGRTFTLLVLVLLAIGIGVAYSGSFGIGFYFDDTLGIAQNPSIRSLRNIPSFFTDPHAIWIDHTQVDLRPILLITYAANYAISGLRPWSY